MSDRSIDRSIAERASAAWSCHGMARLPAHDHAMPCHAMSCHVMPGRRGRGKERKERKERKESTVKDDRTVGIIQNRTEQHRFGNEHEEGPGRGGGGARHKATGGDNGQGYCTRILYRLSYRAVRFSVGNVDYRDGGNAAS